MIENRRVGKGGDDTRIGGLTYMEDSPEDASWYFFGHVTFALIWFNSSPCPDLPVYPGVLVMPLTQHLDQHNILVPPTRLLLTKRYHTCSINWGWLGATQRGRRRKSSLRLQIAMEPPADGRCSSQPYHLGKWNQAVAGSRSFEI